MTVTKEKNEAALYNENELKAKLEVRRQTIDHIIFIFIPLYHYSIRIMLMLPEKWGHNHYNEKCFFKCSSKTGEQIDQSVLLSLILLGYTSCLQPFSEFSKCTKQRAGHFFTFLLLS